jgi:hypothetical protein
VVDCRVKITRVVDCRELLRVKFSGRLGAIFGDGDSEGAQMSTGWRDALESGWARARPASCFP